MWRYTAERHKSNSIVVGYDLMVEPNANEVLTGEWLDPELFYDQYGGTLADWNQLYPHIVSAVRQVDLFVPSESSYQHPMLQIRSNDMTTFRAPAPALASSTVAPVGDLANQVSNGPGSQRSPSASCAGRDLRSDYGLFSHHQR
ncbi:MAG: hypothetical protein ACOC7Y_03255 [Chloroflexota bacterium]